MGIIQVSNLIATNLAGTPPITALQHRVVENALLSLGSPPLTADAFISGSGISSSSRFALGSTYVDDFSVSLNSYKIFKQVYIFGWITNLTPNIQQPLGIIEIIDEELKPDVNLNFYSSLAPPNFFVGGTNKTPVVGNVGNGNSLIVLNNNKIDLYSIGANQTIYFNFSYLAKQ